MLEYAAKASSYADRFGTKYPILKKGSAEPSRSKKADLAIIGFNKEDFETKSRNSKMTYWYIKHKPFALLEFKLNNKEAVLKEMKKDLKKLAEWQKTYENIGKVYFCFLTNEMPSDEELNNRRNTHREFESMLRNSQWQILGN